MPFQIVRNDITKMQVDAIVTSSNPKSVIAPGVDSAVHQAAGPKLLRDRQKLGIMLPGSAAITKAYDLDAKYVIHTVGPVWQGGDHGEQTQLKLCYEHALAVAYEKNCRSIAFPMISTGAYGFPKDKALEIAISVFTNFLNNVDAQIYLVVYDSDSYRISERYFDGVAAYIDENYVDKNTVRRRAYGGSIRASRPLEETREFMPCMAAPAPKMSLEDMLKRQDAGFSETLLRLIDEKGHKDSTIYKRANLSKQHFSKIRNNPGYKPTKATALALAVALQLDLEGTRDLIERAGYALTNSSKFDLIVRYFIEQKNYNILEINMALYEFDQPLLGC